MQLSRGEASSNYAQELRHIARPARPMCACCRYVRIVCWPLTNGHSKRLPRAKRKLVRMCAPPYSTHRSKCLGGRMFQPERWLRAREFCFDRSITSSVAEGHFDRGARSSGPSFLTLFTSEEAGLRTTNHPERAPAAISISKDLQRDSSSLLQLARRGSPAFGRE